MAIVNDLTISLATGLEDPNSSIRESLQPSFVGQKNNSVSKTEVGIGRDKNSVLTAVFLKFNLVNGQQVIPPHTHFFKADLQLFATTVDTASLTVGMACPVDGLWRTDNETSQQSSQFEKNNDCKFTINDTTNNVIASTNSTASAVNVRSLGVVSAVGTQRAGQCITNSSGSDRTIGNCRLSISKQSGTTGSVVIKVFNAKANDGTDDSADGTISNGDELATSDSVDIGTGISTSATDVQFLFSGANRITLTNGNRYVFLAVPTYTPSGPNGVNFIKVHVSDTVNPYTEGSLVNGDEDEIGSGWGGQTYGAHNDLPHIYDHDGDSIIGTNRSPDGFPYEAPQGPILSVDVPSFTATSTWFTVADISPLLNSFVNSPQYKFETSTSFGVQGPFPLVISTPAGNQDSDERLFNDARIIVSYRDRIVRTVTNRY